MMSTMQSFASLIIFSLCHVPLVASQQSHKAQAWQSQETTYTFPEMDFEEIMEKPNVGITFSGGGDRSYIASIGYLAAFHELGQ